MHRNALQAYHWGEGSKKEVTREKDLHAVLCTVQNTLACMGKKASMDPVRIGGEEASPSSDSFDISTPPSP